MDTNAGKHERFSDEMTVQDVLLECLRILSKENDHDVAFNSFLEHLAKYYRADRAYVFEFDLDDGVANNSYEWCRPGVSAEKDSLQDVPLDVLDRWMKLFKTQGEVYISSVSGDLDKNTVEYETLNRQHIDSLMAAPLYTEDVITGFLGVDNPTCCINDLTLLSASTDFISEELKKRELIERLRYTSYVDMLTELNNRNKYVETCTAILEAPPEQLGIVFADVNGMKEANDQFGHERGDAILRQVAQILKRQERGQAFRIGGDEFVVVFEGIDEAGLYAEVSALRKAFHESGCDMSVGHAWGTGAYELRTLVNEADQRMYAEKKESHRRRGK